MTTLKKRILDALDKRGIWGWFENITKTDKRGGFPWHGRAALRAGHDRHAIRVEWRLGTMRTHAYIVSEPDESKIGVSGALPGFALYTHFASPWLRAITDRIGHRVARVSVHDGAIWWESGNWSFVDALLGKQVTTTRPVAKDLPVDVPMPEGVYQGSCTLEMVEQKRPRWFGTTTPMGEVRVVEGVPIPGKGESPHDIDDDAVFAHAGPARSPAEAVGNLVGSVLTTRWRRAGASWRPKTTPTRGFTPTECVAPSAAPNAP